MKSRHESGRKWKPVYFILLPLFAVLTLSFQNCGSQFSVSEQLQLQAELGSNIPGSSDSDGNVTPTPTPTTPPAPVEDKDKFVRGINIMDLGIADNAIPGVYGTNYTKPNYASIKVLKDRGMGVLRIPFKWERVQNQLSGPLNTAYFNLMLEVLRDADTAGIKIILDMHNYGRYKKSGVTTMFGQDNGPTTADYADVWKKLVQGIRADEKAYRAVYAFDIMNEPYSLPSGVRGLTPQKLWEEYSQAAVSGIRSTGETKMIHVEGYSYASADRWPSLHPKPWINDPVNNIMYHAHVYLDNDASGTYKISHAEETTKAKAQNHASIAARGIARVKNFSNWCAANSVRGFIGEYGWPTAAKVGTSEATLWNKEGEEFLRFLDDIKMGATMWATGTWLSADGNILNAYVLPSGNRTFQPLSQAEVLERHPGN